MRRGWVILTRLAAALLVLMLAIMGGGTASAQDAVVRFRFFLC